VTAVEQVRVGDVLTLERIPVQPDPMEEYVAIGVRSFGRGIFHYDSAAGDKLGSLRFFVVNPGRLVVSNIKGWEGAIAVSSETDAGCVASNRFLIYNAVDHAVDIRWARWFFLSEPGIELIQRASPGSADRNRTLAVKRFEDLVIPLPTLDRQRRIAAWLDKVAEASTNLFSRIERAAELARAVQVSLASGAGDTRDGWTPTKLADLLEPSDAQVTVEADAEYRIAGIYSFGKGLIDRGVILGAETSYKTLTRLNAGEVVVSKLNGWEGAVTVVDAGFQDAHVSGEYPTFVVDQTRMLPSFFRGVARSPAFWDLLNQAVRGSMVRRRRISATDFLRATIGLPPVETQARISRAIDELDRALEKSALSAARVGALTQAALNREFGTAT
jgi:type I restriction enzyme, S subunit